MSQVARRYDLNANPVFTWLRDARFASEDAEPLIETLAAEIDETTGTAMATFLPVELGEEVDTLPSPDASAAPRPTGVTENALAGGHRVRIEGAYNSAAPPRSLRALSEPEP